MTPVHLIDAKRSPIGRFGGGLKSLSAADLATLAPVAQIVRWTPTTDLRGQMQRERTGTELWQLLALAAVALIVADTVLGNRFSFIWRAARVVPQDMLRQVSYLFPEFSFFDFLFLF